MRISSRKRLVCFYAGASEKASAVRGKKYSDERICSF